jgi:hypothetical protein
MIKEILNLFKPKKQVTTDNPEFKNVEWAFQFNNDEPVLLANAEKDQNKLVIKIGIKENSVLTFKDGKGNEFKIFARERIDNFTFGQKTI